MVQWQRSICDCALSQLETQFVNGFIFAGRNHHFLVMNEVHAAIFPLLNKNCAMLALIIHLATAALSCDMRPHKQTCSDTSSCSTHSCDFPIMRNGLGISCHSVINNVHNFAITICVHFKLMVCAME